ncbi:MAG TPA: thiamine pyrophosphate-dependent dehydrogenase E1 component subunit alpha [Acidimicrobiales bacterium]|nr:thiamine pyrophosphate-dependent dehydrogenase E1 component subunit alpha [Acidimicrobiales bacterium]
MDTEDQAADLVPALRRRMFEIMVLAKACDERLRKGIGTGEFMTVYWPSRGQEAVAAGFATCLRPDDRLVTTYRGLHDQIAKGVPLVEILGEMLGRQVGASRGKGGTMHIADPSVGLMLSTGIVGAGVPVAVGLALAARRQGSDRVVLASFGDGATNTGSFHEATNLAATWRLPVVLVCQNNRYAEMTPTEATMPVSRISDRAKGYDMPGAHVDGNDPEAVHRATAVAVDRARSGGGPTLIECLTYRFFGHFFGDPMAYIPKDELAAAIAADPVGRFADRLLSAGVLDQAGVDEIDAGARHRVDEALATVLASPPPTLDELGRDVYADLGADR